MIDERLRALGAWRRRKDHDFLVSVSRLPVLVLKMVLIGKRARYGSLGMMAIALSIIGCSLARISLPDWAHPDERSQSADLIAYVGTDGNIYSVDPSDGMSKAWTDDARSIRTRDGSLHYYSDPSWSSKGKTLAFMEVEAGPQIGTRFSVRVRSEEEASSRVVFSSPNRAPIYLYWSPDGEKLSFITSDSRGGPLALHLVPVDGGPGRVIDTGQPYYWAWSPTGREIVAHVGGSGIDQPGVARLSLISLEPEVTEKLWDLTPLSFQAPAFSPDGRSVLLAARSRSGSFGLLRVTAEGQVDAVLSEDEAPVAFAWSPGGKVVATMTFDPAQPTGLGRLSFIYPEAQGEGRRVETRAERVLAFFWSPDGDKLAYFVPVLPGTEGGGTNISLQGQALRLSLAIADPVDGSSQAVTTFTPSADFLRILPFFDQYMRSTTLWSPDSNRLVLPGLDAAGREAILIVSADGSGEPTAIAKGSLAFWSWE